ncbi:TIGR03016 family PEP-CTERM system-associated outer membrane protein [Trichloromonas sp.]|uniref:TIGR03016 family PEP-CTERM system-associated outer membrane protein n=1 Tax=Trichloromonas sp. TaxID=3069249 RepID=UPI003D81BA99
MKHSRIIFAVLSAILLVSSSAWAEFRLTPGFSLRQEYDDNIYLTARDEESDFITIVRPSINLNWETRFVELSLNLGLEYEKYLHNSNEDELRPSQGARFDSTWSLYKNALFLRVSDSYERVPIDEGDKGGLDNKLANLTDRNRLIVNPYLLLHPLRTLEARFDYQYENVWYRAEEGDDAETHRYSLQLTKEISPRISAILYGGYTQYRPRDASRSVLEDIGDEEYDRTDARLNLLWNVTEKFTLGGNVGRAWLDYDYSGETSSTLLGGRADYQLSRTVSVGTSYQEDISDSVENGAREQKRYSAYYSYADRAKASLTLFKSRDDYIEIQRQDDSMGAVLAGELPITNKKGVAWSLNYTDYEKAETEDYDRYGARVEFYHDMRLGRFALGYTWNRNDSDIQDNNYTSNIIFAQVVLSW